MKTKTIKLKSGIIIRDSRSLGCGITIENQNTEYMTLSYSSEHGFYLNIKSTYLSIDHYNRYYNKLEMMRISMEEANQLLLKN